MGLKSENMELYIAIDEILWNDWDPIGVNDTAPRDEYQGYTPEIFELKIKGGDVETIANRLNELVIKYMGLFGNIDHCRQVATKIVNLK